MEKMSLGEIAYRAFTGTETETPAFANLTKATQQIWENTGKRIAASVGRADATEGEVED